MSHFAAAGFCAATLLFLSGCGDDASVSGGSGGKGGGASGAAGGQAGAGGPTSGAAGGQAGAGGASSGASGDVGTGGQIGAVDAGDPDVGAREAGAAGGSGGAGGAVSQRDAGDASTEGGISNGPAEVRFVGRTDNSDPKGPKFAWSGTGIIARFSGTSVGVKLAGGQQYTVVLDGVVKPKIAPNNATTSIATGLADGPHLIELYRRTEAMGGESQFLGFDFGAGKLLPPTLPSSRRLEVIGDSISCGFGIEGVSPCDFTYDTENHYLTYEAIAARNVGADLITTAWSGKGAVCNVGDGPCVDAFPTLYDRTLPNRTDSQWDFASWQPHAVLINLCTNDYSSAVDPTQAEFVTGYGNFLRHIRSKYANALILCTCGSMLGGADLTTARNAINASIADVGDPKIKSFDMPPQTGPTGCNGHPSLATQKTMADLVTAKLKSELGW